jgi:hypothetical protein
MNAVRWVLAAVLAGVCGMGCGGQMQVVGDDAGIDAASPLDAAADAGIDAAADATVDAFSGADAGGLVDAFSFDSAVMADAGGLVDAFSPDSAVMIDAGHDAGTTDAATASLGPVQCRTNSDCGGGTCNRTAPGGICDCAGSCPGGTSCSPFGACVRDCATDVDCNAGMRCTSNGCAIRSCSAASPCPAPYVCGTSGRCERPACGGGCPSPLSCAAGVCVEP